MVTRESESFDATYQRGGGTFKVPLAPRWISLELESARPGMGLAEVFAGKTENAKRREELLSAFAGNWCGERVR
jgi:hypothetical protein